MLGNEKIEASIYDQSFTQLKNQGFSSRKIRNKPFKQMHKTTESSSKEREPQQPISLLKLVARNIGSDRHNISTETPFNSSIESILRKSYDGSMRKFPSHVAKMSSKLPQTMAKKQSVPV